MVQMKYLLMNFLTSLFNTIQESERIPEEVRSAMVRSFKNKGDVQCCSKTDERTVETRLTHEVF